MIFIAKSQNKNLVKNNPGADRPVYFWIKIPAENRANQQVQNHALDSTETLT